jgi:glutathione S-transferase
MPLDGPVTLVYFDIRGRAELPRLIMHAAGQSFEESTDKAAHDSSLLFGQVPLIVDGDKKIVQSRTIARYLAKKLGLSGKSEADELLCDQLFEGTEDIYEALWPACTNYRGGSREAIAKTLAEGGNVHKYLVSHRCVNQV